MPSSVQVNGDITPKPILWRLMIPIAIIIFSLISIGVYIFLHQLKQRVGDKIRLENEKVQYAFREEVGDVVENLSMMLIVIADDERVKNAIKSKNKDILYKDWKNTFQELQSRFSINHLTFSDSNLNRILRVHQPHDSFGKVNRVTSQKAKVSNDIFWGFEVQPGLMELPVLRVVAPVIDNNVAIGFIEFGVAVDEITSMVHEKTGITYVLTLDKNYIEKGAWEKRASSLDQVVSWDVLADCVIASTSLPNIADIISKNIINLNKDNADNLSQIEIFDEMYAMAIVPIVDVLGNQIGRIYFFSCITHLNAHLKMGGVTSLILSGLVIVALFSFLFYMLRRTDVLALAQNRVLKESENKYRVLFDKISYGVILHDINGNFIDINQKALDYHGFSREELLKMNAEDIIHTEYVQAFHNNLPIILAGKNLLIDTVHIRKDGSTFPVEVQPSLVVLNEKPALLTVIRDLSESQKSIQKIQYQSTLFQAILNTTNDGFWIVDKKGWLIEANDNYCRMSGYSRDELLQLQVSDLESYKSRDIPVQSIKMLYDKGSAKFDAIHKRKDGSFFDVRISLSVNKKQNETITFIEDITHIKEYEQKLVQSNNRFKLAEVAGNIASWEWDIKKDNVVWSGNASKILGYDPGYSIATGKSFFNHIYEDDHILFSKTLSESIENKKDFRLEFRIRQKDGSVIWVLNMASVVVNSKNEPDFMFGVLQDINKRKRSEMQLEKSLQEKELLLNEIHHRVKNNLQIISSLIYLQSLQIKDDSVKEIFSNSLNRIKSMAILHELLYQSKNFGSINIYQYIKRIVFELQEAYNSSVSLKLVIDPECTIETSNAVYYGLIINELISNAFKHAFDDFSKAEIQVGFVSNLHDFVLSVSDNGKGIKNRDELSQSNSLGFKIVKTLTNQLNGKVSFKNENGTKVEISLPKD
jgi:PAS domain S-box-containing protein